MRFLPDLTIEHVIIEADRTAHIGRPGHEVAVREAAEVITGDHLTTPGHIPGRYVLIGPTGTGRMVSVVIAARAAPHTYGLVTAWPSSRKERRTFAENWKGED